jgi:hypothetical protein
MVVYAAVAVLGVSGVVLANKLGLGERLRTALANWVDRMSDSGPTRQRTEEDDIEETDSVALEPECNSDSSSADCSSD